MPDLSPEERLSAYLDGELTAAERAQTERLLAENAQWRNLLEEYRTLRSGLQALPRLSAPASLADAIRRQIESQTPAANVPAKRPTDIVASHSQANVAGGSSPADAAPAPLSQQPRLSSAPQPARNGQDDSSDGHWQRRRWLRRLAWPMVAVSLALFLSYWNRDERSTVLTADRSAPFEPQARRAPGEEVPTMRAKDARRDGRLGEGESLDRFYAETNLEGGGGGGAPMTGGLGAILDTDESSPEVAQEEQLAAASTSAETQVVTLNTPQSEETVRLLLAAIAQQGVSLEGEDSRSVDWLASLPQLGFDHNEDRDAATQAPTADSPAPPAESLSGGAVPAADAPASVEERELPGPRSSALKKAADPAPTKPNEVAETAAVDDAAEDFRVSGQKLRTSNSRNEYSLALRGDLAPNEEALVVELVLSAEQWAEVVDGLQAQVRTWDVPGEMDLAFVPNQQAPTQALPLDDTETRKQLQSKSEARPAPGAPAPGAPTAGDKTASRQVDQRKRNANGATAPATAAVDGPAANERPRALHRGFDDEQEALQSEDTGREAAATWASLPESAFGRVRIVSGPMANAANAPALASSDAATDKESLERLPAQSRQPGVEKEQKQTVEGAAKSAAPPAPAGAAGGPSFDAAPPRRAANALAQKPQEPADRSKQDGQRAALTARNRRGQALAEKAATGDSAPADEAQSGKPSSASSEAGKSESFEKRSLDEKSAHAKAAPEAPRLVRGVLVFRLQPSRPVEAAPAEPASEPESPNEQP